MGNDAPYPGFLPVHEFAMHPSTRREKIQLKDVLEFIPPNDWTWIVDECDGIGVGVTGFVPEGGSRELDWADLCARAELIDDMWWFHAVAFDRRTNVRGMRLETAAHLAVFDLLAFDSTLWKVAIPNRTTIGLSALGALQRTYPEPPRWVE